MRTRLLALLLLTAVVTLSGCGILLDAAFRELDDDGHDPLYEHQPYASHVLDAAGDAMIDAMFDDDCDRDTTVVVVYDPQCRHYVPRSKCRRCCR